MSADSRARFMVEVTWTIDERAAVTRMYADELARGWVPKLADLLAAIGVVRAHPARRGTSVPPT